uniref:Uncharacterized protein n=1 Tax=Anguilla anguilla TaxID=7936 RepID=A0A0E9T4L8_ANGAN
MTVHFVKAVQIDFKVFLLIVNNTTFGCDVDVRNHQHFPRIS